MRSGTGSGYGTLSKGVAMATATLLAIRLRKRLRQQDAPRTGKIPVLTNQARMPFTTLWIIHGSKLGARRFLLKYSGCYVWFSAHILMVPGSACYREFTPGQINRMRKVWYAYRA